MNGDKQKLNHKFQTNFEYSKNFYTNKLNRIEHENERKGKGSSNDIIRDIPYFTDQNFLSRTPTDSKNSKPIKANNQMPSVNKNKTQNNQEGSKIASKIILKYLFPFFLNFMKKFFIT